MAKKFVKNFNKKVCGEFLKIIEKYMHIVGK